MISNSGRRKRRFFLEAKWRGVWVVLLCALFGLPGSHAPVLAQDAGPEYVVQPGDSLYGIAQAFGTTVAALQDANAIADPALLAVGARLVIPGYAGVSGLLTTHELAVGDTLASLAFRLDSSRDAIVQLNRIVNPAALYLGQPVIYAAPEDEAQTTGGRGRFVGVAAGDSLPSIAARYGVTVAEIVQANALQSTSLHIGQRLFVPGGDDPPIWLPAPVRSITLQPLHPVQGEPMEIVVALDGAATLTGSLGAAPLTFVDAGDSAVALVGIHAFTEPGIYALDLQVQPAAGEPAGIEFQIPIADGGYAYQAIVLPPEQSALLDDSIVTAELARLQAVAAPVTPVKRWTGDFVLPVQSDRVTATFGLRRSYNGGPYASFHGGIDYGGPSTTPVLAPAAGEVVLAERLQIRGNAVILDHGWGVYTGYWHLSEIDVEVGESVPAGGQIGRIGSTGLSTGNHLHWEVWVGGNQVNPLAWLALAVP